MESPLLATAGAVQAQGPDTGVAAHYGDPFAEQRALARSAGVVDRSHHGVLRITGEDRLSWLHSLTTQDTENLAPGLATQALVLSPNGHVEHHLTLTDDGSAVWIHVEPGTAGPLLGFLESMKKEWAWRVSRGESTRNLQAFAHLLEPSGEGPGAEDPVDADAGGAAPAAGRTGRSGSVAP